MHGFMPPVGWRIDHVIGHLSRGLHVRRAKHNTVSDLGPYLGVDPEVLFPAPGAPRDVARARSCLPVGRGRELEILRWQSQHVPLCPRYQDRHTRRVRAQPDRLRPLDPPALRARAGARSSTSTGGSSPGPGRSSSSSCRTSPRRSASTCCTSSSPSTATATRESALFHGEFFWTGDLVRSIEAVRQSCIDARTLVAWLRASRATREVGVTGFSMGASIAMVLACLDPTPDYMIPIVGHLQLADAIENAPIFWRMKTRPRALRDRPRRAQGDLRRAGPRAHAPPPRPPRRQLWIMARDDGYVTAPRVEEQWRAWGRPPIEWIPGGHMTFAFSLPHIIRRMKEFHAGLSAPASPQLAALQS